MQILNNTDDLRICETKEVIAPVQVHQETPITERAVKTILTARTAIHNILSGQDDRLLVVVGPCSIHDTDAALNYATKLKPIADQLSKELPS